MNRALDATILRYVGYGLLGFSCVVLLYLVRGALPIFFTAGLVAYAMEPLLRNLEKRGWRRTGAVGFVALVFFLLSLLGLALLASAFQQAQDFIGNSGNLQARAQDIINTARGKLEASSLPRDVKKSIIEGVTNFQGQALSAVPERVQLIINWALASLGEMFVILVVLPIVTLWLMVEANPIRSRALMIVPPQYRRDVTSIVSDINEMLGRYVRGQVIICGGYGLLCMLAFYGLSLKYGMGYPIALGLLAGLVYIIPYLGVTTVIVASGATAYFTASEPVVCAGIAVACCMVFSGIMDYLVAPRVLGRGVGLHPLMIIFALLCGAQLGGPIGMILSVPFFAALRVIAIRLFPQLTAPIPVESPDLPPGSQADNNELVRRTTQAEQQAQPSALGTRSEVLAEPL